MLHLGTKQSCSNYCFSVLQAQLEAMEVSVWEQVGCWHGGGWKLVTSGSRRTVSDLPADLQLPREPLKAGSMLQENSQSQLSLELVSAEGGKSE